MTGALPFWMTENRERRWRCLKTAFMVCCILSAALFGFTAFSLSSFGAGIGHKDSTVFVMFVSLAITAFIEVVVAIGTACYCCCCSELPTSDMSNNTVIFNSNSVQMGLPTTPQVQMPVNYSQGHLGMWLVPGQDGGQPVMYHVIGMSPAEGGTNQNTTYPAQGGTNQNTAYPSALVFDQSHVQNQNILKSEQPATNSNL